MKNTPIPFTKSLEEYVFRVAHAFIDTVDPALQTALIQFIRKVDSNESVPDENNAKADELLPVVEQAEWQQVLQKPVDWKSVDRQWLADRFQRRVSAQTTYVRCLTEAIQITQAHLRAAETNLTEPTRTQRMNWYKQMISCYEGHLAKVQSSRHANTAQLENWQKQI